MSSSCSFFSSATSSPMVCITKGVVWTLSSLRILIFSSCYCYPAPQSRALTPIVPLLMTLKTFNIGQGPFRHIYRINSGCWYKWPLKLILLISGHVSFPSFIPSFAFYFFYQRFGSNQGILNRSWSHCFKTYIQWTIQPLAESSYLLLDR